MSFVFRYSQVKKLNGVGIPKELPIRDKSPYYPAIIGGKILCIDFHWIGSVIKIPLQVIFYAVSLIIVVMLFSPYQYNIIVLFNLM